MNRKFYADQIFVNRLNVVLDGVNITWVASRIGLERKTIYAWKDGSSQPRASQLAKFCRLMNVDAGWLLGLKESRG